jgi:hypothetical protein
MINNTEAKPCISFLLVLFLKDKSLIYYFIYLQETVCSSSLQLSSYYSTQQGIRVQERNKLLLLGIFPALNHRLVGRTISSNIVNSSNK